MASLGTILLMGLIVVAIGVVGLVGAPGEDGVAFGAPAPTVQASDLDVRPPAGTWNVYQVSGTAEAADDLPVPDADDAEALTVQVASGATGALLELRWSTPNADLRVEIDDPAHGATLRFGDPDEDASRSLRLDLSQTTLMTAGRYTAHVYGENVMSEPFELAITVFYHEPMPADFTAFP